MARRFLFIMDPVERILPDKDTTFVFMLESQKRGHEVYICGVSELFVDAARPGTRARRAELVRAVPHCRLFEERIEHLTWFDAIFMRKDPPVDLAYVYATHVLSLLDPSQTFVMNHPRGLRDANEKLYALHFPTVIPPSIVSCDRDRLKAFMDGLGAKNARCEADQLKTRRCRPCCFARAEASFRANHREDRRLLRVLPVHRC